MSNEVVISGELLVDLFRVGNVLEEREIDVTEGIPVDAKLVDVSWRSATNEFVLHLDKPTPTPTLRARLIQKAPKETHG